MTHPAQAVAPDTDAPSAATAIGRELAARDLYDMAIAAGAGDAIWGALREQHESYAQRLAGIAGVSANTADADMVGELEAGFGAADPSAAAIELENALAAEHTALLSGIAGATPSEIEMASALASIVTAEARQATVLALIAGESDPEVLYVNPTSEAGA
jgi:hypothetical protein